MVDDNLEVSLVFTIECLKSMFRRMQRWPGDDAVLRAKKDFFNLKQLLIKVV